MGMNTFARHCSSATFHHRCGRPTQAEAVDWDVAHAERYLYFKLIKGDFFRFCSLVTHTGVCEAEWHRGTQEQTLVETGMNEPKYLLLHREIWSADPGKLGWVAEKPDVETEVGFSWVEQGKQILRGIQGSWVVNVEQETGARDRSVNAMRG